MAACHHTRCEFKMEHLSRGYIVHAAGSGSILTLDFLARQLLQALLMRFLFRTGASDMAVMTRGGKGWLSRMFGQSTYGSRKATVGLQGRYKSRPIRYNRPFQSPADLVRIDARARKPNGSREASSDQRITTRLPSSARAPITDVTQTTACEDISDLVTLFVFLPRRLPQ